MTSRTVPHALLSLLPLLLCLVSVPASAQLRTPAIDPSISYTVEVPDFSAEKFRVQGTLSNVPGDTIIYHFPIWAPGAYDIVNFGAYVSDFTATAGGRRLAVTRTDTNTFRIVGPASEIEIAYTVDDIERGVSPWFCVSDIEKDFVAANAAALFGYAEGSKQYPVVVTYQVPDGWNIAIGLIPALSRGGRPGARTFFARDYDELLDAPLMMGPFREAEFKFRDKSHIIALNTISVSDSIALQPIVDTTAKIVRIVSEFFGDIPYDQYVFQIFLVDPRKGGPLSEFGALEHRNSSTYLMPYLGQKGATASGLADIISHEFFHAWSPKRIHVAELGPFDYQRAPRTNSLWFAEGITEYYAQVLLARNGMLSRQNILTVLGRDMLGLADGPQDMSIADLSLNISTVPVFSTGALYAKGPVLGMLMDVEIRSQTGNRRSLDDAMRYMNENYGRTGKTFGDADIIPIIEQATGAKLKDFYDRYIAGTQALPLASILPKAGLQYGRNTVMRKAFGGEFERTDKGLVVKSVTKGGTFDRMKIQVGDIVTKALLSSNPVPISSFPEEFENEIPLIGTAGGLVFERDGVEHTVREEFVDGPVVTYRLDVLPDAPPEAIAIRSAILGF